ncbi:unnamed protein product [marine sediment metagenome]|uniref:Uncharacterized protein n=1 Tax=marine sediment metagenome TaxID=412755 RepID=X0Z781_9ZZZZ
MKRKILITFFVILLILALTGCVVAPELTDRSLAEEAVYNYWQAIINRQYELAKCCCIIDRVWYNKVDEWEEYININSEGECSFLMIYFDKFYKPTEVIGDTAIVYARIITDSIVLPCKKMNGLDIDIFEYETELIKQNYPYGDWELK